MRLKNFIEIGQMVEYLSKITIYKEDEEFINMFLEYPFIDIDEFVCHTIYTRADSNEYIEKISIFNIDLMKSALNIERYKSINKDVVQKGIIDSAIAMSNNYIDASMLKIVRDPLHYNLYLVIDNKFFIIPKLDVIKPKNYSHSINFAYIFPFKYDEMEGENIITNELYDYEKILFFIPNSFLTKEKKTIKKVAKFCGYTKEKYILKKIGCSLNGNFYLPYKKTKR